ncbi:Fucoxanthin-chlorophyll a-c binding protein E [Durusdinium trenchii]|uniref:Chloroplastic n=1 Tax=Durusdinium trenchii TaxID=1381693 RepID=A0ABP0RYW9_9DINO
MASKKCGAAIGLAGAAASTAFIAGTGSSKSSSLRGVKTHQAAPSAPSAPSASTASYAAASVLAASVGAVMARRPVSSFSQTTVTALKAFEQELGVQPPVGYWDPAGLARDGDVEAFQRRRSVELKHGRIAMLATMGYITPEIAGKFPGYLSPSAGLKFADVPNGLAAISKVPAGGWTQILLYMGWCEVSRGPGSDIASGRPGDFGWYVLSSADPETKKKKLSAELANGRLAMMAIIGMFYQDGLTGSAWGDWSNFTDSPLRAFENETGVQPPVGYWDPLGLAVSGNQSDYKRRREVELKHGRVAMFATIGYILPEYWRFPGYLSKFLDIKFSDVPNGLAAFSKVPALGWLQIVGFAGIVELNVYNEQVNDEPGNYGSGFLGLRSVGVMNSAISDPEIRKKKLNAELANGRLAMMAIIGMFFQDGLTGSAWGDWANYTDSPLRAFETELGVQPPVGFWDPLGLSADGDVEVFQRRREVELKHGRISMFACMGYIVPEYFKFPGELSPKMGLKFADIPNGLAALTKVPGQGWAQIVAFLGTYELFINKPVGDEPGNYGKGNLGLGFFGPVTNPEARKKKLSAELANGRLAMMAIIGMFFQDGLTGSAWGDWANYTDSPLRSGKMSPGYNTLPEFNKPKTGFEGLIGDQAPLGFWDPLGLAKDKDVEVFKRRRETEIKHGRVAMFATMGYIVPEYYKFDGYLSPSLNLKFTDVPNGLKALSVVPKEGWAQMLAFAGFLELVVNKKSSEPGNYGKGNFGLGNVGFGNSIQDPAKRNRQLSAELANGRLAMMAIIGMFFQDGLTGSAWGDWANYTESPLRSGKMSPGYNTLPEFNKPKTGFEGLIGDQAPLGFWDPLGLAKDKDVEVFKRRRETEIKHGRVAMFATMGYIVPEYYKFDGYLSPSLNLKFTDVPNGLKALSVVPKEGWAQMLAFAGFLELVVNKKSSEPGNYGKGNFGLGNVGFGNSIQDPAKRNRQLSAELANGRLAMMAIIGMFFQDGLTGSAWGDWSNYTDSPLRAFETELGVQKPVGFWDPLGFTKGGDAESFRRRRYVELKHGRVAMFACMGYIVPEFYRWPGDLSPSLGLKFSDVPNGFAAFSKVPLSGWAQMVAFAGTVELFQYTDDPKRAPGDFENAGFLGIPNSFVKISDPEVKQTKLAAEIANGRLAMMAIIGMFFQNGLTGEAWGDWSLYTDSPLRAFEGELGVQAPVGFWDPLGLSADGDVETFKRRRAAELKHGRICMLACVGYIVPEYFRWPGYLSPEKGLKFADMPHGIAAISKVPLEGWVQIVLFLGHYEGYFWRQDPKRAPGDYEGYGFLGAGKNFIFNFDPIEFQDPQVKKTKLAAELANGRLAMVALMAMLFQNGTVGTTGPAMWLPAA